MMIVIRYFIPSVYFAVAAMVAAVGSASAQQADDVAASEPCEGSYERMAFDAADTDGDGMVSEAELARDAAAGFTSLDEDGSMTLTPQELGPHDAALFSRIDTDGDGVLTFSEVMVNKVQAVEDGDENGDGGLSFEEMVDVVEQEWDVRS